jgi:pilus assembly protein CpaE
MNLRDVAEKKMTLLFVCIADEIVQAALSEAREQQWSVAQAVFEIFISAHRRPHLPETLRSGDGCIAFVNFDLDPERAKAAAQYLQQLFHNRIVIIAVSSRMDTADMLAAMQAGCSEFLTAPLQEHAMQAALTRAGEALMQRASAPAKHGSVLALLGAKGGVGTTTLGVHLATYLVQNSKQKVLLIDSKAQFGHVCIYLGTDGSGYHFQEVVSNVDRLDSVLLEALMGHHSSGLDLLSSPDLGQTARPMHPDDVALTLEFLRSEYDFIIVDCNDSADAITRAIIAAASQVYLVATPDITAIRDLSRHVDDLSRMDTSCQIQVVINRYSSQFAVNIQEIEKAIRMPVSFSVPNNYIELVRSANIGEPVSVEGKSGFTTELLKWAHSLVGTVAVQPTVTYSGSAPKRVWRSLRKVLPSVATAPFGMSATGKRA